MCGIVGVFGAGPAKFGADVVARMNATITHRGPDDHGVWAMDSAAIGMRRLSIIDLSGGHQPMVTEDGVAIVFNGEIYNYRTLREELRQAGYRFRTTSDTEVVLNLYHHAGVVGLDRLEGMYGICIVDPRSGEAHLIRDHVGIKPLYYGTEGGRFYFGSEIKAILAGMEVPPKVNLEAISHYLTLRYVPSPDTVWTSVSKLEPGTRLTYRFDNGSWTLFRYWTYQFESTPLDPYRNYEEEFEQRFLGAVESHLVTSDVPVGILLSGGLDSSAVAAASMQLGMHGLHTFSVGFREGGTYSELPFAEQVAKHIGATHHEVLIGETEFLDFLDSFVWHADEPLADLASIPLYFVSRLARQHVKVVLSGEGADEVLAGYDMEKTARQADSRRRIFGRLPRAVFRVGAAFSRGQRRAVLRSMAEHGWSGYFKAWSVHDRAHWTDAEKRWIWRADGHVRSTEDLIHSWFDETTSDEPVDKAQQVSCGDWLVEDLLMKADKMTMANSIELRVPFLDRSFIEWAQSLPLRWKVGDRRHGYQSKYILRSFARRFLPAAIVERPKRGFPVPAYEWMKGPVGQWAEDLLRQSEKSLGLWIDLSRVHATVSSARAEIFKRPIRFGY